MLLYVALGTKGCVNLFYVIGGRLPVTEVSPPFENGMDWRICYEMLNY